MGGPGLCACLSSPHLPAMSHSTCHGSQSPEGPASPRESQTLLLSDAQEEASPGVSPTKRSQPTSTSPECTWASRALSHPTGHRPGFQQE